MKTFSGKVLFLDRSDINTDEIIPAKYLTEHTKIALQPYLLEDLKLQGFDPRVHLKDKQVIITRSNFGCGSSREHAAWALEVNGIHCVISESFARIFKQNMYNCGLMAVELESKTIAAVFEQFSTQETCIQTDFEHQRFIIQSNTDQVRVPFCLTDFQKALIKSGGWVDYADATY
ncbi:MAG: 3-isopropylmalate dehydratase small subunit [Desulfobacterales bacterium]|nr:3-isopropylmalate dehydratase small subunit [Desulfobacterales bacterium]